MNKGKLFVMELPFTKCEFCDEPAKFTLTIGTVKKFVCKLHHDKVVKEMRKEYEIVCVKSASNSYTWTETPYTRPLIPSNFRPEERTPRTNAEKDAAIALSSSEDIVKLIHQVGNPAPVKPPKVSREDAIQAFLKTAEFYHMRPHAGKVYLHLVLEGEGVNVYVRKLTRGPNKGREVVEVKDDKGVVFTPDKDDWEAYQLVLRNTVDGNKLGMKSTYAMPISI